MKALLCPLCLGLLLVSGTCRKPDDETILVPVNVSNNPGESEFPACAIDSRGTVHVVWTDDSPGKENILYSFGRSGDSWSKPIDISNSAVGARLPAIAIGSDDRVHVAWQDASPDGFWRILYSRSADGESWSVPETVSGSQMYVNPGLAVDADGRVHVCWQWGGFSSQLRYSSRDTNGLWSEHVDLTSSPFASDARICVDRKGSVHVVYWGTTPDFASSDVWYVTKPADGVWSLPLNVSSTGRATGSIGFAVDGAGYVHLVWSDDRASRRGGMYRTKAPGGQWSGTEFISACSTRVGMHLDCMLLGPGDELIVPVGATPPEEGWRYLGCVVRPSGGVWSDTIYCGMTKRDPYDVSIRSAVCGQDTTLYLVGGGVPGIGDPDKEDIFCIECRPLRR